MLILLITIVSYLILLILAIVASKFFTFLPPAPGYSDDENVIKLILPDGSLISAIHLFNPDAKYTFLYSHGNAEDLTTVRHQLLYYLDAGFSVFAYDYPGYGTSEGQPNEKKVYQSVFAAYNYLVQNLSISPSKIIAFGFSIGSAPTLELVSKKPVAAIILQSPFLSAFRVVTYIKLFPYDVFDNTKKISHIKAPILIYHGTADEITPPYHSRSLSKMAPEPKTYVEVPQADHNNLLPLAGQAYWNALHKFVDSL